MDRRHLLAGLAVAAAGPAFAQTHTAPIPVSSSPAPTAGAGAAGAMSAAEQQWMQGTMMAGAAALQTSQIALEKAQDEDVKLFAKFEADEQKGMAEVLQSMMSGSTSAGAPPMPKLEGKHAELVQKLQQAKAGEAFEKEYIRGQVEGHRELLQIQETLLKSNPTNREAMNVAKLARSRIQEHLETLELFS